MVMEAFNASFAPRLPGLKLTAAFVVQIAVASQGCSVAAPSLTVAVYPLTVVAATQQAEVAVYALGVKPIGQWTVGTDSIAAVPSTTRAVAIQQAILDFESSSATQGHTVAAPTANTNVITSPAVATQGHTAAPLTLVSQANLVVVGPTAGHTVAAPALVGASFNISTANAITGFHIADGMPFEINLDQQHAQGVPATIQGFAADIVPLVHLGPAVNHTPQFRTFQVQAELRQVAA